jgi:hypothetical protein
VDYIASEASKPIVSAPRSSKATTTEEAPPWA